MEQNVQYVKSQNYSFIFGFKRAFNYIIFSSQNIIYLPFNKLSTEPFSMLIQFAIVKDLI